MHWTHNESKIQLHTTGRDGFFLLDDPGGMGNTFVTRAIQSMLKLKGKKLAMPESFVAAKLLDTAELHTQRSRSIFLVLMKPLATSDSEASLPNGFRMLI